MGDAKPWCINTGACPLKWPLPDAQLRFARVNVQKDRQALRKLRCRTCAVFLGSQSRIIIPCWALCRQIQTCWPGMPGVRCPGSLEMPCPVCECCTTSRCFSAGCSWRAAAGATHNRQSVPLASPFPSKLGQRQHGAISCHPPERPACQAMLQALEERDSMSIRRAGPSW